MRKRGEIEDEWIDRKATERSALFPAVVVELLLDIRDLLSNKVDEDWEGPGPQMHDIDQ